MRIPGLRAAMIAQAPRLFARYGLKSPMAIANMMGEFTEEDGGNDNRIDD
jgi:putative chitinase